MSHERTHFWAVMALLSACGDCSQASQPTGEASSEKLETSAPAEPKGSPEACKACSQKACRNYKRLGVDVYAGCLEDSDAAKVKACASVVECARRTHCAFDKRGPEECYCGAATTEDCARGQGISGVCKGDMEVAAGKGEFEWVTTHFGDRSLALGNAVFLLKCERDSCRQECSL